MKRVFLILFYFLMTSNCCFAITFQDIQEVYKVLITQTQKNDISYSQTKNWLILLDKYKIELKKYDECQTERIKSLSSGGFPNRCKICNLNHSHDEFNAYDDYLRRKDDTIKNPLPIEELPDDINYSVDFYTYNTLAHVNDEINYQSYLILLAQDNYLKNIRSKKNDKDRLYYDFLNVVKNSCEQINNVMAKGNIYMSDVYIEKNRKKHNKMGFDYVKLEGNYFFKPNYSLLSQMTDSPAWKEWLFFKYSHENDFSECYISIQPEETRKIIVYLENFKQKYPNFIDIKDIDSSLISYFLGYTGSCENRYIVFSETNILKEEYKKSYELFLRENQNSMFYSMLKEYYYNLKNNHFVYKESLYNSIY